LPLAQRLTLRLLSNVRSNRVRFATLTEKAQRQDESLKSDGQACSTQLTACSFSNSFAETHRSLIENHRSKGLWWNRNKITAILRQQAVNHKANLLSLLHI
jgi:hypothetical protein